MTFCICPNLRFSSARGSAVGSSCIFLDCTSTTADGGADASAAARDPQVGSIVIGGSMILGSGLTLAPDVSTGTYASASGTTQLFSSGNNVTVTAACDPNSIGSFSASALAPADITVTAPTYDATTIEAANNDTSIAGTQFQVGVELTA